MHLTNEIEHIYLSGIGGTGMAALANLLLERGLMVSGSDNQFYPPMGEFLKKRPITLYEGFSEKNLIAANPDLVVIGNALSRGNPEVEYVLNNHLPYISMAGALKMIFMKETSNIVIAGTHGKTTTTSLLARIFNNDSLQSSFMVGGIPLDFNTPSRYFPGTYFIIEGDEYDSAFFEKFPKFLQYAPQILILNNIEFDHADIYNSLHDIIMQFRFLLRLVPENGMIIANGDDKIVREVCQHAWSPVIYYGKEKMNEVTFDLQQTDGSFFLEIFEEQGKSNRISLEFPLEGMAYNMTAAYIAAREAGIPREDILQGFNKFKGVKRRLEKIFDKNGLIVYDDFAHHPTAVRITLTAIKQKYPDQPVLAVFEPRSNTSIRNIFIEEYKQALLAADQIFLAPAFKKASVNKKDALKVDDICTYLNAAGKKAFTADGHEQLFNLCKTSLPANAVIVLMSNGSFEPFKSKLLEYLNSD